MVVSTVGLEGLVSISIPEGPVSDAATLVSKTFPKGRGGFAVCGWQRLRGETRGSEE